MRRTRAEKQLEQLYLVTQSHYDRLVENCINGAQPRWHTSCDWLGDPLALGIMFFPVATYERLRALNHGINSSS